MIPEPYARTENRQQISAVPAPRPVSPARSGPAPERPEWRRTLDDAYAKAKAAAQGLTLTEEDDLRAEVAALKRQVAVLLECLQPTGEAAEETEPAMARPPLYVVPDSHAG
jgi:hypothetical protein